jgi:hypothetical protein
MIRTIGPARLGFAAALLALLLGPLALGVQSTHAQGPDSAQYYGIGLSEGDTVAASIDGTECASTTANAAGDWVLQVGPGDCSPEDGNTVNFSLNGELAEQTETWSAGGTPSDPAGVTLTVSAMPEPEPTPDAPEPGETGNAGLVSGATGSSLLVLALGILAVAGIAGARVSTRRVS